MANKKQAAKKECFVVARYAFKSNGKLNGTVCSLIRTSEGKEHSVWTHTNGCASSCDCEGFTTWHKKCFHIKSVEAVEAARQVVVAEPVATPELIEVVQPVVETPVAADTKPAERQMSTIEANLPTWLKATMAGQSRNGTFAGRGTQDKDEQPLEGYFNGCPTPPQRREHSKVYNRFDKAS